MAKINEIDITSLTFQEGSAPTTPASTKWKIYAKTDGLYYIDDAGAETGPLGGGGGGSAAVVLEDSGSVGTGTSFTITAISTGYEYLELIVLSKDDRASLERDDLHVNFGDGSIDTGASSYAYGQQHQGTSAAIVRSGSDSKFLMKLCCAAAGADTEDRGFIRMRIYNYDDISRFTNIEFQSGITNDAEQFLNYGNGAYRVANAVDQIQVSTSAGASFVAGEYWLIGVL